MVLYECLKWILGNFEWRIVKNLKKDSLLMIEILGYKLKYIKVIIIIYIFFCRGDYLCEALESIGMFHQD